MKKFWKQIVCGLSVFFFSSALFCCAICNLTQKTSQANVDVRYDAIVASSKIPHSCCPPHKSSPNEKRCHDNNCLLVLLPEKIKDAGKKAVSQVAKIIFYVNGALSDLSTLASVENSQSPSKPFQSVPIYLFDRVLRL